MSGRMDLLRARVLRLLEETDAGASENWRDSDPGYWIGAAEGAYAAERERDKAREVLREIEWSQMDDCHNPVCPVCGGERPTKTRKVYGVGHLDGCRLDACLRARSGGSDRGSR